jgi:hypothetical protein
MTEKPTSSKVESPLGAVVEKANDVDPTEKILSGLQAIVVLAGILVCLYLYEFANAGLSPEQEHWGQFGDFFGGTLNPIIGLMTLLALVWTVRLQHQLLREAKRQVKVSEDELKRTSEALEKQAALQRKQAFESTFFSLLSAWQSLSAQMDVGQGEQRKRGKDCFVSVLSDFDQYTQESSFSYRNLTDTAWQFVRSHVTPEYDSDFWGQTVDAQRPQAIEAYVLTYYRHRGDLGAYFRSLYHLIKFIDKSDLSDRDRRTYTSLVRAQFSPYEHVLLFYNALSPFGYKKFFPLVEKYALLKNLDESLLISNDEKHFFPHGAWASSPIAFPDELPDRIRLATN